MRKPKGIVHQGTLRCFFETGTEGIMWSMWEDNKEGYGGMIILEAGDYLTVYWKNNAVLFQGKIIPDFLAGWQRYYRGSRNGQPTALWAWVCWTQKGWMPNLWALLFYEGYRAEVIKKNGT